MDAVLYLRTATPDPASLARQQDVCRGVAAQLGYDVVSIYTDPSQSGATVDRPSMVAMTADVFVHHKADAIICESSDRLSRKLGDLTAFLTAAEEHGVKVVFAREQICKEASLLREIAKLCENFERTRVAQRLSRRRL